MQLLARQTGLVKAIDDRLKLLKRHVPYYESDHVLNIAYNILCNGDCLEDLERLGLPEKTCSDEDYTSGKLYPTQIIC